MTSAARQHTPRSLAAAGLVAAFAMLATVSASAADPAPTAPAGAGVAAPKGPPQGKTWTKEATCNKAWSELAKTKMIGNVKVLKENDCAVMHKNGWLPGPGVSKPEVCVKPWNALASSGAMDAAKALVSYNCPIMAKSGWK